jgi:hypothetical protein
LYIGILPRILTSRCYHTLRLSSTTALVTYLPPTSPPLPLLHLDSSWMAAVGTMSYPARDSYQAYPQQYAHYSSRAQQAPAVTTSSLAGSSYPSYTSAPQQQHQPQQHHTYPPSNRSARSSHSPSSDDGQKPSLPSISNLFGMVDGERSSQEHGMFLPLITITARSSD